MPSYKLTYFNLAGAGECIRYLFAYAKQPYEDNRIAFQDWQALKPNTPYGQLPILEVDGKVVPQSTAIGRYLAKQFGLLGKNDWEALEADVLIDTMADLKKHVTPIFYAQSEEKKLELKKELLEKHLPFYLEKFEKIAASNPAGFLVGSEVTWGDLFLGENLTALEERFPGSLKPFPALNAFVNKINGLPEIKAWLEKRPIGQPIPSKV
ncbi:unnamed protein product [Ceutorhynchus assimilis]|uniref:glutathione transferase n=1 Tax=Ceutorhynchus assimilis TaxID=467358 RepID=A0A9N9QJY3_9CUCU|nr:unnamed protein product [Ceutorhynchus assimilis]